MVKLKFYFGTLVLVVMPIIISLIGLLYTIGVLYSVHWFLASSVSLVIVPVFCLIMYKWLAWIIDRWL